MSDLIKHIDELYQKATEGPWIIGEQEFDGYAPLDANTWWGLAKVVVRLEGSSLNTSEGEANAALIVALVNAWPQIKAALVATNAECICPKCGLRHGGKRDENPGF